ncbi:uncharacterized protein G2W53_017852 [Senna tora]|uniref:Uncharacterized protein n=1 Tax=Senna tora TaxID=362788 RepID=A0A834TQV2_9FABA|nr:uncharacterized protein G2W53_017852 [Senna tora]
MQHRFTSRVASLASVRIFFHKELDLFLSDKSTSLYANFNEKATELRKQVAESYPIPQNIKSTILTHLLTNFKLRDRPKSHSTEPKDWKLSLFYEPRAIIKRESILGFNYPNPECIITG